MINVGITGQNGFLGMHLTMTLNLIKENFNIVSFQRTKFGNNELMDEFVSCCDVIVHLAAVNRHSDENFIYNTNIELVNRLKNSLERTKSSAHVLMASSIHEYRGNAFGDSKKDGRLTLSSWASKTGNRFTGLIIPNVYGPFGEPHGNSVVATFCHQLTHGEIPELKVDNQLDLVYVGDVVKEIIRLIKIQDNSHAFLVQPTHSLRVTEILDRLKYFQKLYFELGEIPILESTSDINLFNTFRCYINSKSHFPIKYSQFFDERGKFVELLRSESRGQLSYSTTAPGVTRGNHFHTRKIERFMVIHGTAKIKIRRVGSHDIQEFDLDGNHPSYVDIPIWFTHNLTNIGSEELITIFWINEPYQHDDPDTFFEAVET